jgi:hypothetical protein
MQPLTRIPLVDIRGYTPLELLFLYRSRARFLAESAAKTIGSASAAWRLFIPAFDRASHRWLKKSNNPYLQEMELIAGAVGVPGTFALNTCFEWGCTSGVWPGEGGPLLRRVLDWPFPSLGENTVVAHQSGIAGDYFNVTWPGFSGILQAMAPGRFAAALNQAPMRKHGAGLAGDWLLGRVQVGRTPALPPSHLLRLAFETARDYAATQSMLCMTPLAVPAIYTLSGKHAGEGCVIERTENGYSVRPLAGGKVCATNQFESPPADAGQGWRPRPIDSRSRLQYALAIPSRSAGFSWFTPPIANVNSRLAMTADAAAGTLTVLGTAGAEPVTEVFELPV